MQEKTQIIDKVIYYIFLALVIITPLIFTTQTAELFEVPKMYFVYTISVSLFFTTLIKFASAKYVKIPTTTVTITFAIFLIVQAISTIISTDKFTSVFGYPTRLNGGLLSQFAYFVVFITALINLDSEKAKKIIDGVIFAAVAVSLWGIPSYFNLDPTCLVLIGKLTSSCWQIDFNPQLRIFSTLGQPNWLASYLVLALPIAIYKVISTKNNPRYIYLLSTVLIFLALVLTNSLSGILGAAVALFLLLVFLGKKYILNNLKTIIILAITLTLIALIFSSKLTSRIKDTLTAAKASPAASQQKQQTQAVQSPTSGGTDSGQIRLIVWKGALDVFKKWPILGAGPETFVNTYYLFRPTTHNQTTEWKFFYNKAHNEFLNYLANTGALGFTTYIALIISILFFLLKSRDRLLFAIASALIGYQTTIFFGFSTVATAATFTVLSASGIIMHQNKTKTYKLKFLTSKSFSLAAVILIFITGLYVLTFVLRFYFAAVFEKRAQSLSPLQGLVTYRNAITIHPTQNPYLLSDFAYNSALQISKLENEDNKEILAREVESSAKTALNIAPNNYITTQRIAKAYLLLLNFSPNYKDEALSLGKKLTLLAPTFPDSYNTLGKIQITAGEYENGQETLQKALFLKPDNQETLEILSELNTAKH